MDWYRFEREEYEKGIYLVCGIDEAGRGPLAGPVYAAAVILPEDADIPGINDSKKLSEKKREALFDIIKEKAIDFCIASATETEIDTYNILNATFLAMKRAVEGLKKRPDAALVDGNRDPKLGIPTRCIVGGDAQSASIAAASILAKVSRDRFMKELDREFPEYGFAIHKGYGTKHHYEMLGKYGPCDAHRQSFLKKWNESKQASGE